MLLRGLRGRLAQSIHGRKQGIARLIKQSRQLVGWIGNQLVAITLDSFCVLQNTPFHQPDLIKSQAQEPAVVPFIAERSRDRVPYGGALKKACDAAEGGDIILLKVKRSQQKIRFLTERIFPAYPHCDRTGH